jgi:hypothetical protein
MNTANAAMMNFSAFTGGFNPRCALLRGFVRLNVVDEGRVFAVLQLRLTFA